MKSLVVFTLRIVRLRCVDQNSASQDPQALSFTMSNVHPDLSAHRALLTHNEALQGL